MQQKAMFREQTKKSGPTVCPWWIQKKSARKKESGWKFTPFHQNTPFFTSQRGPAPWSDVGWRGCVRCFFFQQKKRRGLWWAHWDFLGCAWSVDIMKLAWMMFGSYGVEARSKIWKGGYLRLGLVDFSFQICKTPYSNIGTMIVSTPIVVLFAWPYHLLTFKQKQLGRLEDRQTDSTSTDINTQYMALTKSK